MALHARSSARSRGIAVLAGAVVRRHRVVEPPAEVLEQAHAPRERRGERIVVARGAVEAAERLVPVAADLEGLAGELLDRGIAPALRQERDRVEDRIACAVREQRRAVRREQAAELRGVAGLRETAQCFLDVPVLLEPLRRAHAQGASLGLVREELGERELANGSAERVPARRVAMELDEEAAPGERPEDLGRALDSERLAQLGREALERGDERARAPRRRGARWRRPRTRDTRKAARRAGGCRSSASRRPAGGTPRRVSTASRTAAGQPPVARCSSAAVSASSSPVSATRSPAVSSTSNARSEPLSSSTWPWPRKRSMGNEGSTRDARTMWTCAAPAGRATR